MQHLIREHTGGSPMNKNEGNVDRIIRAVVVAPLALVLAAVLGFGTVGGIVALVVAAIMLVTAAVGTCPLYSVLHVNTCPLRSTEP